VVTRLSPAPSAQQAAALAARLHASLELHLANSAPAAAGEDEDEEQQGGGGPLLPQWSLQCSRRSLGALVGAYLGVASEAGAAGADGPAASAAAVSQHEAETWQLVRVLYEHIDGEASDEDEDEDEDEGQEGGEGGDAGSRGDEDMDGSEGGAGGRARRSRLAAMERRARLSAWLQRVGGSGGGGGGGSGDGDGSGGGSGGGTGSCCVPPLGVPRWRVALLRHWPHPPTSPPDLARAPPARPALNRCRRRPSRGWKPRCGRAAPGCRSCWRSCSAAGSWARPQSPPPRLAMCAWLA
jgi:hypothetical protein